MESPATRSMSRRGSYVPPAREIKGIRLHCLDRYAWDEESTWDRNKDTYFLDEHDTVLIGRAPQLVQQRGGGATSSAPRSRDIPENSWVLPCPVLSRSHALLKLNKREILISDAGSHHGVWRPCYGTMEKIVDDFPVNDGDIFTLGKQVDKHDKVHSPAHVQIQFVYVEEPLSKSQYNQSATNLSKSMTHTIKYKPNRYGLDSEDDRDIDMDYSPYSYDYDDDADASPEIDLDWQYNTELNSCFLPPLEDDEFPDIQLKYDATPDPPSQRTRETVTPPWRKMPVPNSLPSPNPERSSNGLSGDFTSIVRFNPWDFAAPSLQPEPMPVPSLNSIPTSSTPLIMNKGKEKEVCLLEMDELDREESITLAARFRELEAGVSISSSRRSPSLQPALSSLDAPTFFHSTQTQSKNREYVEMQDSEESESEESESESESDSDSSGEEEDEEEEERNSLDDDADGEIDEEEQVDSVQPVEETVPLTLSPVPIVLQIEPETTFTIPSSCEEIPMDTDAAPSMDFAGTESAEEPDRESLLPDEHVNEVSGFSIDCAPSPPPPAQDFIREPSPLSRKRPHEEDEEEEDELENPSMEIEIAEVKAGTSRQTTPAPIPAAPTLPLEVEAKAPVRDLPSPSKRIKIDVRVTIPSAAGLIASAVAGSVLTFAGLAYL